MLIITSQEEIDKKTGNELVELQCVVCNNNFYRQKRVFLRAVRGEKGNTSLYCSSNCARIITIKKVLLPCQNCNKTFEKSKAQIERTKKHFCSQSCAAKYNNTHKTKGTRVSKLEVWLQTKLQEKYPTLEFHYNRKDAINSELDIYIPSLKLAFELNGIFHYEPIFGQDKLEQILNNDNRKFQACLEAGIELCIIDTNQMKQFKEQKANQFLDIIISIINMK